MSAVTLASTDLAILQLRGGSVTWHADGPGGAAYAVVRTPDNPRFWWGNFIKVLTPGTADAAGWLDVFTRHFPAARHVAIGLPEEPDLTAWQAAGRARGLNLDGDGEDILALRPDAEVRLPAPVALAPGYVARQITSDADWAAVVSGRLAENARTHEHPHHEHQRFVEAEIEAARRLAGAGRAAWFGAFTGAGELAAQLGIVDVGCADGIGHLARYQTVVTDSPHRRQGLASHLVGRAAAWAAEHGAEVFVIHADEDSAAGRIYRRLGFEPAAKDFGLQASRR